MSGDDTEATAERWSAAVINAECGCQGHLVLWVGEIYFRPVFNCSEHEPGRKYPRRKNRPPRVRILAGGSDPGPILEIDQPTT